MKSNYNSAMLSMARMVTLGLCVSAALVSNAYAADKIKVGIPLALSGPPAQFCEPMLKGAQMYVDEINAKGGVLGKQLELISRDSKAKPEEAVRVSRELISREKVDFLVGTFTSRERGQGAVFGARP
jgi:branched-chain amino acid transport system substrate-binding protein